MEQNLDFYQTQHLEQDERSIKYFLSSTVLHLALAVSALIMSDFIPLPEQKDLIEISVPEIAKEIPAKAIETPIAEKQNQLQKIAEVKSENEISESQPIITKKIIATQAIIKPFRTLKPATIVPEAESKTQNDTQTSLSNSDEFNDQALASSADSAAAGTPALKAFNENDLDEDLDRAAQESVVPVASLKSEMHQESEKFLTEQEKSLDGLKDETTKKSQALRANAEQIKKQDQEKIHAALAREKAESDRLAEQIAAEKAAQEASQKAAQAAQEAARAAAERARVASEEARIAAENARMGRLAKEMALGNSLGVGIPVKALQDLKQMPGNKRPTYDSNDRLASKQGEITFLAYVELNGTISKFKLIKSTGHRSLDAKTYSAIKNWKFYPGDEGWVEIPFKWDLKGGAQELPATLRRSLSQK